MKTAHRLLLLIGAVCGVTSALADQAPVGASAVYQQRLADGRIVLTDRPVEGARVERSWQLQREDPAAARVRGERVRAEAKAVSERVQRRIDEQQWRTDDFEMDRLRSSLAEARRDAQLARENVDRTPAIFLPRSSSIRVAPRREPGERNGRWRPRNRPAPDSF